MIACMSQDPPPLRRAAAPAGPMTPPSPVLEYGPRPRPPMDVAQYLLHFTAAATVVGVLLFAMLWAGRMKRVFVDFGMKLPRSTQILLDLSDASRACYAWVALAIVPFAAPFLLARLRPESRRWVAVVAFLLSAVLVVFVIVAMFEPMVTLFEGVSGKR
jgi:hypothetical protein